MVVNLSKILILVCEILCIIVCCNVWICNFSATYVTILQKEEVCVQLNALEKCFKMCHIFVRNKKTHVVFFISCNLIFLPHKCPGLYQHRPGHSLGKSIKLHEMKNEKNYVRFLITKIWQIWKHFSTSIKVSANYLFLKSATHHDVSCCKVKIDRIDIVNTM